MARADYQYWTHKNTILIVDLDRGGMSVTNNIEEVVQEIKEECPDLDKPDTVILYQDSDKTWTGWDEKRGYYPVSEDLMTRHGLENKKKYF